MVDVEEAEKKILSADPSFRESLQMMGAVQKEVDSARILFRQRINDINGRMKAVREEKAETEAEYAETVDRIKKQLNPARRALEQELEELRRKLKRKEADRRDVERDIKEVNSLIERKDKLSLTRDEAEAWSKRLGVLMGQRTVLGKEVASLRNEINLADMKLKVLQVR